MNDVQPDYDALVDRLANEFIDETLDRLEDMWRYFELSRDASGRDDSSFRAFCRDLHTIKGQGSAFGFPSLTILAHHLEDILAGIDDSEQGWATEGCEYLLELMDKVLEARTDLEPQELRNLLEHMPGHSVQEGESVNVVWVCSARVIRHKIRRELEALGIRVMSIRDPFEALRCVAMLAPDAVLTSATLEEVSGIDMVRALEAMSVTRKTPVIVVTSFDSSHPEIAGLPTYVPVVKLGPDTSNQLILALSALELKAVDPAREVRRRPN